MLPLVAAPTHHKTHHTTPPRRPQAMPPRSLLRRDVKPSRDKKGLLSLSTTRVRSCTPTEEDTLIAQTTLLRSKSKKKHTNSTGLHDARWSAQRRRGRHGSERGGERAQN